MTLPSGTKNHDIIFIENLKLSMSIGIYDHEKAAEQDVLISVKTYTNANNAHESDHIDDALSYEHIVNAITAISKEQHFELVETFAEKIAAHLLKDKRATHVTVRVTKPDIFENAQGVGIEISRKQD